MRDKEDKTEESQRAEGSDEGRQRGMGRGSRAALERQKKKDVVASCLGNEWVVVVIHFGHGFRCRLAQYKVEKGLAHTL